jgi:integrase
VNNRRSLDELERRITKHLAPYFGGRRLSTITTSDLRAYVAARQAETEMARKAYDVTRKDGTLRRVPEQRRAIDGVSNAEINCELTTLKRIFSLSIQAGKLFHKPHIPLLREENTRIGFFEAEQFASMRNHLPAELRPMVTFAYITGWRITSEVLPLEWRHVDFKAGEIRLDANTTKSGEGRVFKMTANLRTRDRLKKSDEICRYVFFRMVAECRGGKKQ